MTEWQMRVFAEKDALGENIQKLDTFIHGETFEDFLPFEDRKLLILQQHAMQQYYDILAKRIARF
jgi:hypothetical protein